MNSKFDKLFNTIMEDVKSSKIKAKKVIKESEEDYDDQEEGWDRDYNDYPTITVGDLRKELKQHADPNTTIWFSWNCYSDGGEDCCGFHYDEDSNAFYFDLFTFIPDQDEDQDEDDWGGEKSLDDAIAYEDTPTVREVLNAIESLSDDIKVFGYWDENEGARYCIEDISGAGLTLDGGTEC